MPDILFTIVSLLMFAGLILFVAGCDRLIRRER
jgi:hypothetical protein